jgi:hypothetical protein
VSGGGGSGGGVVEASVGLLLWDVYPLVCVRGFNHIFGYGCLVE